MLYCALLERLTRLKYAGQHQLKSLILRRQLLCDVLPWTGFPHPWRLRLSRANKIRINSAFEHQGYLSGVIRSPLNSREYAVASTEAKQEHRDFVSIRQAAEWFVRYIKGTDPRVRDVMSSSSPKHVCFSFVLRCI
jgi:hypothetical protein